MNTHSFDVRAVAAHVIRHLAVHSSRGRAVRLDDLASAINVRRTDVRDVVTRLHEEGHVDAKRMRLTMTGLAVAAALEGCKLREVRRPSAPSRMIANVA